MEWIDYTVGALVGGIVLAVLILCVSDVVITYNER